MAVSREAPGSPAINRRAPKSGHPIFDEPSRANFRNAPEIFKMVATGALVVQEFQCKPTATILFTATILSASHTQGLKNFPLGNPIVKWWV